ncbi:hypothetical protein COT77_00950 [Candidatus Berkelbacteria bacterium CG10_big_fil_rev_8_21_14_0_10_41_12]|uniref:Aspartyl-tRNA amidotransferase n=1 Tax=Candidatus Berkelbacteria bacterium CG10_big_fil_rev_8_21_14_0_10_41_12 TaxID=1974513 RepID=A0A2M6WXK4_9BACT|nr:MAG: hypothetical protein COT77_00950 [Candidatus Berkelbacteria bacterium CG10_big_fil_rev_8_21_14_0_10_41_12]
MSILEKLNRQIPEYYKSGDSETRIFLQTLKSNIISASKNEGKPLDEKGEIAVLKKEKKQLETSLEQFKSANRNDLADKAKREIGILSQYLPTEMSDDEIKKIIGSVYGEGDDFADVMKKVMPQIGGRAEGSQVARIVQKILSK